MAATYHIEFDEARNLITVIATGHALKGMRVEALRTVRMDPRFRNDYDVLCRFVDNKHTPDKTGCLQLGLTLSAFFRGQKIALVVGKAELAPLRESIAIFNETGRVEINAFNILSEAKTWLLSRHEAIAA